MCAALYPDRSPVSIFWAGFVNVLLGVHEGRPLHPVDRGRAGSILNHMVQCPPQLDTAFAALSDPTRRGVLETLGRADASIGDLAARFAMTLTGMKKHVTVLEGAGLVTTEKVGRVRRCRLGPHRLEAERDWIEAYARMLEARLDRLGDYLARTKGRKS
jgi:DNA-binding transcriptional ArsR family regulator